VTGSVRDFGLSSPNSRQPEPPLKRRDSDLDSFEGKQEIWLRCQGNGLPDKVRSTFGDDGVVRVPKIKSTYFMASNFVEKIFDNISDKNQGLRRDIMERSKHLSECAEMVTAIKTKDWPIFEHKIKLGNIQIQKLMDFILKNNYQARRLREMKGMWNAFYDNVLQARKKRLLLRRMLGRFRKMYMH
jgi:hypothetical protein